MGQSVMGQSSPDVDRRSQQEYRGYTNLAGKCFKQCSYAKWIGAGDSTVVCVCVMV